MITRSWQRLRFTLQLRKSHQHMGLSFLFVSGNLTIFKLLRASFGLLMYMSLNINASGALIVFPGVVWGHNPVNYYEVQDRVGNTRVVANPLAAGDQFSMQFDSLEALLLWRGGSPLVVVAGRQYGVGEGIASAFQPQGSNERDRATAVGYFNLRRAFSWNIPSMTDFVMPDGMAWMESSAGVGQAPLSIAGVTAAKIFGVVPMDEEDANIEKTFTKMLDPAGIADKLELASKPEPTILAILGVLAGMLIIAVLRVNYELHR